MKLKLLHSIILTMIATTSFAQNSSVEYDMQDSEGRRLIQTRSVVALKPSKTIFPISISLDYYEAIPGCYYLMLYGRYPLSESTILSLTFEDGETVNVEPYSLNVATDRLGLITPKKIYMQYFMLCSSLLNKILSSSLKEISVNIDGTIHNKVLRNNEVSMWLKRNYNDIETLLLESSIPNSDPQ